MVCIPPELKVRTPSHANTKHNQGRHVESEFRVRAGNLKTPFRAAGEGSVPCDWVPMDVMASEGSAGDDPEAERARCH